jgi:hypothetical protein
MGRFHRKFFEKSISADFDLVQTVSREGLLQVVAPLPEWQLFRMIACQLPAAGEA